MNHTQHLDTLPETDWLSWLTRWDVQQTGYLPDREERFTAMLDVLDHLMPDEWTALDLACGPGSISQRLLARFPQAECIALDYDPVLLAIGQGVLGDMGGKLRWLEVDLLTADLTTLIGEEQVDAVLSTTALHWLPGESLWRLYLQLGKIVRPGGVFLNGDNMKFGPHLPTFQKMADTAYEQQQKEAFEERNVEDWERWWDAVKEELGRASLVAEREARFGHRDAEETRPNLDLHKAMLSNAGFKEVETIWQNMDNRIVMAVR